jgi:hypothetical protein
MLRDAANDDAEDRRLEVERKREIIASLAGRLAEEAYSGAKVRRGSRSDMRMVISHIRKLGLTKGKERRLRYKSLIEETERLVERHWREIQAVAGALIEHGTIFPEHVREIILLTSASL